MLARRFTIICLVATLMAFGLISVIQQSTRPAYSWRVGSSFPCIYDAPLECALPLSGRVIGKNKD